MRVAHIAAKDGEGRASPLDRRVLECSEKLYAGALGGQDFRAAWAALAHLFGASDVQLRWHVCADLDGLSAESQVLVFDRHTRHDLLLQALARSGADHGMCAVIGNGRSAADVLLVLRKSAPFRDEEVDWMQLLAPHVGAALDLGARLASAVPTIAAAAQFARLFPLPCVLLDEAGQCMTGSEAFGRMFAGISGVIRGGRVAFEDLSLQQAWEHAVAEAQQGAAPQSFVADAPNGSRWKIHVLPLASVVNYGQQTPGRLFLAAFERLDVVKLAGDIHLATPLTKAEGEVLGMLLVGQTAKAIARARGASVNTVRSQITAILAKTGHHTQKQLIASVSHASVAAGAMRKAAADLH